MKTSKIFLTLLLFLLLFGCTISLERVKSLSKENKRLKANEKALLTQNEMARDEYGAMVAKNAVITIKKNEFSSLCSEQEAKIKALGLRVKDLQSYGQLTVAESYPIHTQVRDSLIVYKDKIDTLKCVNYEDKWLSIHACVSADTIKGEIKTVDSLIQTVSIERKKFLWFKYGCKGLRQTIRSANPYTTVLSARYIKIE